MSLERSRETTRSKYQTINQRHAYLRLKLIRLTPFWVLVRTALVGIYNFKSRKWIEIDVMGTMVCLLYPHRHQEHQAPSLNHEPESSAAVEAVSTMFLSDHDA
jgi:ribosomal protein L39E